MMPDTLIVGAGITGLTIARELLRLGNKNWELIDKGRSVGGRMATRRLGSLKFDHGAQFFTVRSEAFEHQTREWLRLGLVKEWCRGFLEASGQVRSDSFSRYAAVGGMNQLPKQLAASLPSSQIHLNEKIEGLAIDGDSWRAHSESGRNWFAKHVVFTTPIPQGLLLLSHLENTWGPKGTHPSTSFAQFTDRLKAVRYDPCIAILASFSGLGAGVLPVPYKSTRGSIAFVGDNFTKRVSSTEASFTIHLGSEKSQELFTGDDGQVLDFALHQVSTILPALRGLQPSAWQIHRWRYATPTQAIGEPFLQWSVPGSDNAPPAVIFAGEAFGGPRIEAAYLSGLATAERLAH
jgi:renalase